MCVRLWRVDSGVSRREVRPGERVRLMSPSHGAATNVWLPLVELVGAESVVPGRMYRVLLGPDISSCGIWREVVSVFVQPGTVQFKAEMEVDLLTTIHSYADALRGGDLFTDGSVIQESDPVVNAFIPSPTLCREVGNTPVVAGAMIVRPNGPATHGLNAAFRIENGQAAGCGNSYDIELIMLTLACMTRDQIRLEGSDKYAVWSDCKSAVHKASQMDINRIRKYGHKEHGLLLRRLYHSRFEDPTLLRHVKGHPERRLHKGQGWQELVGCEAGIFLADKLANAKMSADERFNWENDGSVRTPLVVLEASCILKLFADVDLWSVVDAAGLPIIDSPLTRVQVCRFARYLRCRDQAREEKMWSTYILTAPALAFPDERLYHKRAKVTKTVFNWYMRSEHMNECVRDAVGALTGMGNLDEKERGSRLNGRDCQLCGIDMLCDTELHLYTHCQQTNISTIRSTAEAEIQGVVDETSGITQLVARRMQSLLMDPATRHRVWKGIITPTQLRWLQDTNRSTPYDRSSSSSIVKMIKGCMRIAGTALLAMRRKAWEGGGPVVVPRQSRLTKAQTRSSMCATASVASLLGIMPPKAAAQWELTRRHRKEQGRKVQICNSPREPSTRASPAGASSYGAGAVSGSTDERRQWKVH